METDLRTSKDEYWKELDFSWERRKIGLELRYKFELYFPTLVFTLLGLAIQTSKHSDYPVGAILEFVGWGLLLLSGLVSLDRIETLWKLEVAIAEYHVRRLEEASYQTLLNDIHETEQKQRVHSKFRIVVFVIAIVALMISRGLNIR